jgi:hypothetical protein
MHSNLLFEYAVIRIVPRVEREEFLNTGVILYCSKRNFLQARYEVNRERLNAFCSELDIPGVEEHLRSLERISFGAPGSGAIGKLDSASRFRWLTATRSTVVQTSRVHPGFCTDPADELARLYGQLVV